MRQPPDPNQLTRAEAGNMAKPKSTTPSKSYQPTREQAEDLAVKLAAVLKNPACPERLETRFGDALSEIQSGVDSMSADFLCGLFMAPRKEQNGAEI
jgi:hypothetical protein